VEITSLLLKSKAKTDPEDEEGKATIHYCKDASMLEVFVTHTKGGDLKRQTSAGQNICDLAAGRNDDGLLDHIWQKHPDHRGIFDQEDKKKVTHYSTPSYRDKRKLSRVCSRNAIRGCMVFRLWNTLRSMWLLSWVTWRSLIWFFKLVAHAGGRRSPRILKV
jgi:hypothetical protein